jgi:hypothetical protein
MSAPFCSQAKRPRILPPGPRMYISLPRLKPQISEKFRAANDEWHNNPDHHGSEEIPLSPAKKSCMDRARNSVAQTATQIRTGHWRSAVYLKRIKKRRDDKC